MGMLDKNGMFIICVGLILVCNIGLVGGIVYLLRERKEYEKTLFSVLEYLDRAIAGTEQTVKYDENLESAIVEKLNELVIISRMHCEEADKERGLTQSLISDIAHQVRNPLTSIMLYAGILGEKLSSDDDKRMIAQIHRQSKKLDFFMKELVRSSYLETGIVSIHMEVEKIERLIAEACQEMEMAALKKKILFQIQECDREGKFDLKWTKEALVNILDNAIKYSPESSSITICIEFYEDFFCIQIADQGIGIEEIEQGAIFKRFYRSTKVEKEQGLGIGLYLAREIIEKQNGYIKVQSALGQGSIFFVYLPNCL